MFVRSHDSVGDGIGDFRGLTQKLDYLQDLGVTAIWLLPFYPSPLKDDGYDIADYTSINPPYGTLDDFKEFLDGGARARHPRHHRIGASITRPTSIRGFSGRGGAARQSRSAIFTSGATRPRNTGSADHFQGLRAVELDLGSRVAKAYYWHRFYLPPARLEFRQSGGLGGDLSGCSISGWSWASMACGSTPSRISTSAKGRAARTCRRRTLFSRACAATSIKFPGRMLLAEANQWPEDAVAYFGEGDECHMAFHFPLMPRMFMAIHMEDRFPIIDILAADPPFPRTASGACSCAITTN